MRALVSRGLLLSPLVCAALVFGPLGTAAAAVDVPRADSGGAAAAWSSAEADVVLERLDVLDRVNHHDDALDPSARRTVHPRRAGGRPPRRGRGGRSHDRGGDGERLPPAAAEGADRRHVEHGGPGRCAAADPVSDLVAQLQSAIDGLLKALTSLDLGAVLGAVTGLLSPVLGLVTGLLGGATSALPTLPALPPGQPGGRCVAATRRRGGVRRLFLRTPPYCRPTVRTGPALPAFTSRLSRGSRSAPLAQPRVNGALGNPRCKDQR